MGSNFRGLIFADVRNHAHYRLYNRTYFTILIFADSYLSAKTTKISRYTVGLYNCVSDIIMYYIIMYYIITSLRPLTEQELLERRELARLRHMAREATAATPTQQVDENADQAKENNGKG